MSRIFDHNNRAMRQRVFDVRENPFQSPNDERRRRIVQAEQNDANAFPLGLGDNLPKIEVEGEHNPPFCNRLGENVAVG